MRRNKRKKSNDYGQMYIVMNQYNEVFSGIQNGSKFKWSSNWYDAKPLEYTNTIFLRMSSSKIELIKIQDFY